jgi:hypothetical protein
LRQLFWQKKTGASVEVSLDPFAENVFESVDEVLLLAHAVDRRLELEVVLADATTFVNLQAEKVADQIDSRK